MPLSMTARMTRCGTGTTLTVGRRRWYAEDKMRGLAGTWVTPGKRKGTQVGSSDAKRSANIHRGNTEMMVESAYICIL